MVQARKEFKTYGQQLKILHNRGLNIFPVYQSYNILKKVNYYNLINGYNELFLEDNLNGEDTYKENSSFIEIYSLYEFDRNLREIYLPEVLKIEDLVKSLIAYNFSDKYGYEDKDYLNRNNFEDTDSGYRNTEINNLISRLMRSIWKTNNIQPYIEHYRNKHKYVPLWVLVNSMTFGDISKFYSYMKQEDKITIAKELSYNYRILYGDLDSYLKTLGLYRNILAHDERFFKYMKKNSWGRYYRIDFRRYLNLGSIFSSVSGLTFILKLLLDKKDFNVFLDKLMNELHTLETNLKTIDINLVLKQMNFIIPDKGLIDLESIEALLRT